MHFPSYLSIILGRPFGIRDNDISVSLPKEPDLALEAELGTEESRLVPGTVAHIQLRHIYRRSKLMLTTLQTLENYRPNYASALWR
jgi:hypothetical protein